MVVGRLCPKVSIMKLLHKTFTSNKGLRFKVIEALPGALDAGNSLYLVEFEKSGARKVLRGTHITRGDVRDDYAPSVYGLGYLGEATSQEAPNKTKSTYHMWKRMLGMCHHERHRDYRAHGAHGETVCERWHSFEAFEQDLKRLPGVKGGTLSLRSGLEYGPVNCVLT